ncbi:AMP-dependent acyl-CoA synthetase [Rhizocola hellebori]|uniref:AMP-dependent acyl-CoA synthetase n=2 Tax=Rhizocola hellebori TaxID=1392758 RepID=A0A8J3VKH9_9ACTN|nr:AMP-dependent acyl-CoA synthetase [Rhizocola hellebori]
MALVHPSARLVDAGSGAVLSGDALTAAIAMRVEALAQLQSGVVFARFPNDVESVLRYLAGWQALRPMALIDPGLPAATLADLVERFEPALVTGVIGSPPPGYRVVDDALLGPLWERIARPAHEPHPALGVLLATSGSTGNPKFVRLSREAITANATAIAEALHIAPEELAPTNLSLFYSYGMSVLNSHLTAGAGVLVQSHSLLERPFWEDLARYEATSLAAVPYQYEMLRRLRFDPAKYPRLRTLTQAGGRLRTELVTDFHARMQTVDGRMFVMYGQTEAGPRMTTLPSARLPEKLGSVGPAIPGGRLSVKLEDGSETSQPGITGEVIYRGPNVMMGYAERAADLSLGDEQGGALVTGDLGWLDEDGYLFISGRLKRFGKVFGVRLNLDDVEKLLRDRGPVAAVSGDDKIVIWAEDAEDDVRREMASELAEKLNLHWSGFDVRNIDSLPLLASGKVDYRALEKAI